MVKIAVVIVNWNLPLLTKKTISSLKKIEKKNFSYHIYLVDNGSTDNSYNEFSNSYKNDDSITLIKSKANLGFAGGNNLAITEILKKNFDYILLLNNDTEVDNLFLSYLLDSFSLNKNVGIVGPKIYFAPGYEPKNINYSKSDEGRVIWAASGFLDRDNIISGNKGIDDVDHGQYDQIDFNPDFLSGCCLLIKNIVFKEIGLFDDDYFLYLEDLDFCIRAKEKGFTLVYQPKSNIWHLNSGSTKPGGHPTHDYFLTRNRLIFGFRYSPLKTKLSLFKDSFRILINGAYWQKRAIIDYYFNNLGKGSWK